MPLLQCVLLVLLYGLRIILSVDIRDRVTVSGDGGIVFGTKAIFCVRVSVSIGADVGVIPGCCVCLSAAVVFVTDLL